MPSIAALCAAVVGFFAISLVLPALAAAMAGEWLAFEAFLLLGLLYGFLAFVTFLAVSPRLRRLSRAGTFSAAFAMWLALVVSAAGPFVLVEQDGFSQALFEAASAAITLGVTFRLPQQISTSMALYRSMVAWEGGLLTLLLSVWVLGRAEVGGTSNRHLRYLMHTAPTVAQRLVNTFLEVFVPYLGATLVCTALLVLARMAPQDAFNVAMSAISTNGFVPVQTGATLLNSVVCEVIVLVFMIVGGTSILWHRAFLARRWHVVREENETPVFMLSVLVLSLIAAFAGFARHEDYLTPLHAAFNRAFDVVSIMTTTGMTHDARFGIGLPFELMLALALVGGCAYSTAGGIKAFRLITMFRHAADEVQRLVYPHMMLRQSADSSPQVQQRAKAVWSAFFISLSLVVVSAILFSAQGIGLQQSLGLAVGAFSATANLVTSALGLPAGERPPDSLLMLIAGIGIIARVELLVLVAAFRPRTW